MVEVSATYLKDTGAGSKFPGSMGPKIQAAIRFVERSEKPDAFAAIGDLQDAADILSNKAGTIVRKEVQGGVVWRYASPDSGEMKGRLSTLSANVPRNP